MNSLRCVDTRIKHWEMWTISSKISKKILLMMLNVKKSLSSLIRIKITIDQSHALDLKSLNLNSNRTFERSLNHHLKIKWIASIVIIAKNRIIIHVIVVNLKKWIFTISCARWMYMIRMTHRMKISSLSRKKTNLCYSRCKDRWDENNENWCLQLRRHSFRW
jgi:hypothetical protein